MCLPGWRGGSTFCVWACAITSRDYLEQPIWHWRLRPSGKASGSAPFWGSKSSLPLVLGGSIICPSLSWRLPKRSPTERCFSHGEVVFFQQGWRDSHEIESSLVSDSGAWFSLGGKCRRAAYHYECWFLWRNQHSKRSCHLPAQPPARARFAGRADFSSRRRGEYPDNRLKWRRYLRRCGQRALSGAGKWARRRDNEKRHL